MPSLRSLYWDTYQSWVDVLPEKHETVRLFQGHLRGVPKSVCNFEGFGQLPGDRSGKVLGVGAQVHASDQHIDEVLRMHSTFSLYVGDREAFRMHLAMADEHLTEEERETGVVEIPGGFIKMGDNPIAVPSRQSIYGSLKFGGAAEALMRKIGTRVGPGAGWASVITYLVMDIKRPVH